MRTLRKLCACVTLTVTLLSLGNSGQAFASRALAYQVQDITASNLNWYIHDAPNRPRLEPLSLYQWNTSTTDKTATWPDATDPTWRLPFTAQEQLACVRYHESRNHLTSLEVTSRAAGWYQFTPYIWSYAREFIPGLPATPLQATGDQQSKVAVWYYQRNHGLYPEWAADMSSCS